MTGIPGAGGPVPKRSDQRRRTNEPEITPESAPGVRVGEVPPAEAVSEHRVEIPPVQSSWHPTMIEWYVGLCESQQRAWFEPSDWATARAWCDIMTAAWDPVKGPPAAIVGRWQVAATGLLTTEGDRRRLRIELARKAPTDVEADEASGVVLSLAADLEADAG